MTQALLDLDTRPAGPLDRVGFDIGWDHARHALVPPAELMLGGTPISQGWLAARAVFGRRPVAGTRAVRTWLALRLQAWREGAAFDLLQVTPSYLRQIETSHCPVTRAPLGGASAGGDAPVVVRLRDDASYAAGNLVVLSRAAARAKSGHTAAQMQAQVERLGRDGAVQADGLAVAAWARLAALMSLAVEWPQLQAARIPLRALPPNRVRVISPALGLAALLTLRLHAAGWSRRARAIADLLPRPELRHDFNLFVGALAARLMSIPDGVSARELRWAQEDAWADGRVQRRWVQFAQQLGAAESETLLQTVAAQGLGGVRLVLHDVAEATEAWALRSQGRRAPALRLVPAQPQRTLTHRSAQPSRPA
jgi:mRNA-degrading endonuclease toxin of MazEF toxin-antitoxin module